MNDYSLINAFMEIKLYEWEKLQRKLQLIKNKQQITKYINN